MHILHVIGTLDVHFGGPSIALAGLAAAQARAGMKVSIVTSWLEGYPQQTLQPPGVDVHVVGPARGKLTRHPDLAPTISRVASTADVIHTHGMWEEAVHLGAAEARKLNKPYFMTPHGMLSRWSLSRSAWKKRLFLAWRLRADLKRASAIHFITQVEQNACGIALRTPTIVEPIGIDMSEFETLPPKAAFRSRYPAIGDKPLIVFLGRINGGKGLEHLVPAMAQMKTKNAMLAVVGPDYNNFQATIQRMADESGLHDRVIFTGMQKGQDRIAALVDADVFCLPSDHENFSIAAAEALAAGTPAIVSPEVGIADIIQAAGVGAVVKRESVALAIELDLWLTDHEKRNAAAEKCRPLVRQAFNWDRIALAWNGHFLEFCRFDIDKKQESMPSEGL